MNTQMSSVSFFCRTEMAAVTSCKTVCIVFVSNVGPQVCVGFHHEFLFPLISGVLQFCTGHCDSPKNRALVISTEDENNKT